MQKTHEKCDFTLYFDIFLLLLVEAKENSQVKGIPEDVQKCHLTFFLVLFCCCHWQKPIPPEATESALAQSPGFLELFGQCYFFGGFLVGPQVMACYR